MCVCVCLCIRTARRRPSRRNSIHRLGAVHRLHIYTHTYMYIYICLLKDREAADKRLEGGRAKDGLEHS